VDIGLQYPNAALSADAGVIYACTNLGRIAAIREADGELLWLRTYDRRGAGQSEKGRVRSRPRLAAEPLRCCRFYDHRCSVRRRLCGSRMDAGNGDSNLEDGLPAADAHIWRSSRTGFAFGEPAVVRSTGDRQLDPSWAELRGGAGQGVVVKNRVYWRTDTEIQILDLALGRIGPEPCVYGCPLAAVRIARRRRRWRSEEQFLLAAGRDRLTAYRAPIAVGGGDVEPAAGE